MIMVITLAVFVITTVFGVLLASKPYQLMFENLFVTSSTPVLPTLTRPNPASTNCINIGGTLELKTDFQGAMTSWCHFPDGRICEVWALYRDKICQPIK